MVELAPHRCHRWEAAWEDLAHLLRPLLAGWIHYTLLELGRPPLEVDELIQEVYLKLLAGEGRLMRNFSARSEGQLRSYLRRTCQSCVQDALRRTLASKRGSDRTVALTAKGQESLHSRTVDPERRMIRRSHLAAFRRAVAECAERLSRKPERNRWIFEQAILEGRSSASIGREVGLGTSGVDSVVSRIRLRLARQGWEVDKRAVG